MISGNELEERAYEPKHIRDVLAEIEGNLLTDFSSFAKQPLRRSFRDQIDQYDKAR